jgi:hypothetical protein
MSGRFTRALCAAAAASLAIITIGSPQAGTANAAPVSRADLPKPGVTLSVAGEGNFWRDLFYTGTSGQVWMLHMSNMAQPVPVSLGGKLIGGPAAVWVPPNTLPFSGLAVFGRGTDNRLWWRHQTSSGWSAWAPLGGALTSKPTVHVGGAIAPNALAVFVRGTNGAVYGRAVHGTAEGATMEWTPWGSLGGKLLPGTAPASAGNGSGLFVAAVGTDHAIWVRQQLVGTTLSPWRSIGGRTTADPGIASPSPHAVVVFIRGTGNAAWYNEFFGRTSGVAAGWHSMRGGLTSGVTAITQRELSRYGPTSVFALGTDSQPWMKSGTWPALSGWGRVHIDY